MAHLNECAINRRSTILFGGVCEIDWGVATKTKRNLAMGVQNKQEHWGTKNKSDKHANRWLQEEG